MSEGQRETLAPQSEASHVKAIASAARNYFRIIKVPHDEATKAFLGGCQAASLRLKSENCAYYRRGAGPTVLLIHGYNSNLGCMLPIAEDLLASGFKVVLLDAPAHGEASGSHTTHLEVRDCLRTLASELGEIRAVVSHSLGTQWALCAWGERFRARTLVSIAAPASYDFLVEKFVELYRVEAPVAAGLARQLERRFGERVWSECSPSEMVKSIGVPGVIIHGREDDFVPPVHAERLSSSWPQAELALVEAAGHMTVLAAARTRELMKKHLHAVG